MSVGVVVVLFVSGLGLALGDRPGAVGDEQREDHVDEESSPEVAEMGDELEERGENWWELCVKAEIRQRADDRKKAEKEVRWLAQRGDSMIYFTEFGDLIPTMAKTT